jgi:hypothetical protein
MRTPMRVVIVDDDREKLFDTQTVAARVFQLGIQLTTFEKPWENPGIQDMTSVAIPVLVQHQDTYSNMEWAEKLLLLRPDLIITDNGLFTGAAQMVAGIMIARDIRALTKDKGEVVIFANTYGEYGWSSEHNRRQFARHAQVTHGAGNRQELEPALLALKAEKFPNHQGPSSDDFEGDQVL